eukprot:65064-Rhodomonas_salina.1
MLRRCYPRPGADEGYAATHTVLRRFYALSGTDVLYAATPGLCCPVLRRGMLVPGETLQSVATSFATDWLQVPPVPGLVTSHSTVVTSHTSVVTSRTHRLSRHAHPVSRHTQQAQVTSHRIVWSRPSKHRSRLTG